MLEKNNRDEIRRELTTLIDYLNLSNNPVRKLEIILKKKKISFL
jgi:hypothetical protein